MSPPVRGVCTLSVSDVVLVHVLPAVIVPPPVPPHLAVTHQRVTCHKHVSPHQHIHTLTVDVQVLQSVQDWLHQTVGEAGQFVIPQFEPLQRVKVFKGLILYFVDTKMC